MVYPNLTGTSDFFGDFLGDEEAAFLGEGAFAGD